MKSKKPSEFKKSRSKSSSPELKGMTADMSSMDFHYSSSAFQNSPDPSVLPIPAFEDESFGSSASSKSVHGSIVELASTNYTNMYKTEQLRQFLNLRPQVMSM
ncbi:hypothetical protein EON65_00260 [archaeon]|nr:MAG: hypothetical protein EON65_00260 [archaeon]